MKFIIAHKRKSVSDEPVKPTSLFDENHHGPILVDPLSDMNLKDGDACGCCGNGGFFGYWVPSGSMTGINRVWYRNIGCEGDDPSYIQFDTKLNCWELYDSCCAVSFLSSPENINTTDAKSPWDYSYIATDKNNPSPVPSATTVKMYPSFNAEKTDGSKASYVIYPWHSYFDTKVNLGMISSTSYFDVCCGYYYKTGKTVNDRPQYTNNLYYMQYISNADNTYGWVLTINPDKTSSDKALNNDSDFIWYSLNNNGNPEDVSGKFSLTPTYLGNQSTNHVIVEKC